MYLIHLIGEPVTKDQLVELVMRTYKVARDAAVNILDLACAGILGKRFEAVSKPKEIDILRKALEGNGPE